MSGDPEACVSLPATCTCPTPSAIPWNSWVTPKFPRFSTPLSSDLPPCFRSPEHTTKSLRPKLAKYRDGANNPTDSLKRFAFYSPCGILRDRNMPSFRLGQERDLGGRECGARRVFLVPPQAIPHLHTIYTAQRGFAIARPRPGSAFFRSNPTNFIAC